LGITAATVEELGGAEALTSCEEFRAQPAKAIQAVTLARKQLARKENARLSSHEESKDFLHVASLALPVRLIKRYKVGVLKLITTHP
jgi:hypothetical protein